MRKKVLCLNCNRKSIIEYPEKVVPVANFKVLGCKYCIVC